MRKYCRCRNRSGAAQLQRIDHYNFFGKMIQVALRQSSLIYIKSGTKSQAKKGYNVVVCGEQKLFWFVCRHILIEIFSDSKTILLRLSHCFSGFELIFNIGAEATFKQNDKYYFVILSKTEINMRPMTDPELCISMWRSCAPGATA